MLIINIIYPLLPKKKKFNLHGKAALLFEEPLDTTRAQKLTNNKRFALLIIGYEKIAAETKDSIGKIDKVCRDMRCI